LLLLADLLIVVGAMLGTQIVGGTILFGSRRMLLWVVVLVVIWVALARALNAYDLVVAAQLGSSLQRISLAAALTFGLYSAIPYWSPPLPAARWLIGLNAALLFGPLLAWRAAYALLFTRPAFRIRVLVLGHGKTANAVARLLREQARPGYELVGPIEYPAAARGGARSELDLVELVRNRGIREVVVDASARHPALGAAFAELAERRVTVVTADEMYETLSGRVRLSRAASIGLGQSTWWTGLYAAARRLGDVLAALLGLILLAPLLLIAALAIVLDSPGQPLYWQERVGQYGRRFRLVKLRTMIRHAEVDGLAVWASNRDPRITRVGALLRRSRFDEVPQLWNVLRGEMSLIGPRPERPEFVALLTSRVPLYRARHVIRPGITGWAQVSYKYGASVKDAARKLQYDLYYIRHRSLLLDATILLKTLVVMLRFSGT
jgi:exopolysaccharide biosynthesis polyprenyl glycosylphosphotransferase